MFRNLIIRKNKPFFCLLFLFICIQIIIAILINIYLLSLDNQHIQNQMNLIVNSVIKSVNIEVEQFQYHIDRSLSFFRLFDGMIPYETYIDMMQLNNFNLLNVSLTWILVNRVKNEDRYNFENFYKEYDSPSFEITELDNSTNTLIAAKNRSEYWPVTYYTPNTDIYQNNDTIIGFDVATNNATDIIIKNVDNTVDFTGSLRIGIQDPTSANTLQHGVLLAKLAVHENNSDNFTDPFGVCGVIIRINRLITTAINAVNIPINRSDINLFVFDVTQDGFANIVANNASYLYKDPNPAYSNVYFASQVPTDFSVVEYNYQFADRNWTLFFKFSDNYIQSQRSASVLTILLIIPIGSFLVDILIISLYTGYLSILAEVKKEKEGKTVAIQMLGYVNHEVRNPLNVIKGLVSFTLDTLKEINLDGDTIIIKKIYIDTVMSDLSTVSGACGLLEHIVTDILDIRKLESNKLDLANTIICVGEFMKDIIKTVSQKIDEKQTIKLLSEYDESMFVYIDPYRLKQILLNYLTNAIKYTQEGSICIRVINKNKIVRFSVLDTGKGIIENAKHSIFQPFSLINSDDAARYGGIGLGLFLCKMLAERMGGTVGFSSTFNEGSEFWVEYPEEILECPKEVILNIINSVT